MYSSEEFNQLLKALSDDIVYAHSHWQMAMSLGEALVAHPMVESQSRTFWYLTHRAHVSTAIQSLCRVYDQEPNSLSLRDWLLTIKKNISIFDIVSFRDRLKDNSYVESLAKDAVKPEEVQLNQEINLCSGKDLLVKKLIFLRSNYYAHKGKTIIIKQVKMTEEQGLNDDEITQLLDRSISILNRYSYMFNATSHSTKMLGQDDYKFIFKAVDEKVREMRASSIKKRTQGN